MHDAQLYRGLGKDARDGIGKTLETVYTGDKDVLNPTVFKVGKNTEPEVSTLALRDIHAQQFLSSLGSKCQDIIDGAGHGPVLLVHYLVMDGIKPDNRIHRVKGAVLPALYLGKDTVGDAAYGLGG